MNIAKLVPLFDSTAAALDGITAAQRTDQTARVIYAELVRHHLATKHSDNVDWVALAVRAHDAAAALETARPAHIDAASAVAQVVAQLLTIAKMADGDGDGAAPEPPVVAPPPAGPPDFEA